MQTLTTKQWQESIEKDECPFGIHWGRGTTKAQRAENVANFIWFADKFHHECTYGEVLNEFKTYSMDTIEAGVKMFNDFKFGF